MQFQWFSMILLWFPSKKHQLCEFALKTNGFLLIRKIHWLYKLLLPFKHRSPKWHYAIWEPTCLRFSSRLLFSWLRSLQSPESLVHHLFGALHMRLRLWADCCFAWCKYSLPALSSVSILHVKRNWMLWTLMTISMQTIYSMQTMSSWSDNPPPRALPPLGPSLSLASGYSRLCCYY